MSGRSIKRTQSLSASQELILSADKVETLEAERRQLLLKYPKVSIDGLLDRFTESHPESLSILQAGGIHPNGSSRLPNPLTGEPAAEDFRNIGEHSLAVALAADRICESLCSSGALTQIERKQVVHRALIHDACKALEIITQRAIARLISEQASDTFEKVRDLKENLIEFQIRMDHAGRENGHESLKSLYVPNLGGKRSISRGMLPEKIVRLADDMTASLPPTTSSSTDTYYVRPHERVVISQFHTRYPLLYRQGLGIKRGLHGSQLVELADIHSYRPNTVVLGSYVSLQIFAGERICEELKSYINPSATQDASTFVQELITAAS